VLILGWKVEATKKLAKLPLYKMAVDKVLNGNASIMGSMMKYFSNFFCRSFMMRGFSKILSFMTFGRLGTDEMTVPKLLLLTSVMSYAETAQTAYVLPSLLEAAWQESDFCSSGAFLLLVIFASNVLMHMLLFGLQLRESRTIAEQLPRFESDKESLDFGVSLLFFPKDAPPEGTSSVVVTQNALRLYLWTVLESAMWQGNLVIIAGVCAEILKQSSLLLPFSAIESAFDSMSLNPKGWSRGTFIKVLFTGDLLGIRSRTTSFNMARFIFRILTSSYAKAFLKLKALEQTWCALDPTGRVSLVQSILIALFMIGLSLPDAFQEARAALHPKTACSSFRDFVLFFVRVVFCFPMWAFLIGILLECSSIRWLYRILSENGVCLLSAVVLNLSSNRCGEISAN